MRGLAIVVTLVLAAGGLPAVTAFHLSVGATDAVGVAPAESATAPSIAPSSALYQFGTRAAACTPYDPSGDGISSGGVAADAATISTAHPFCGRLRYEAGTQHEVASPPDQHYPLNAPGDTWRFDALITSYVGNYYTNQCNPYCTSPSTSSILNNVLRLTGIWTDPNPPSPVDGYCSKEKPPGLTTGCWQEYGFSLAVPSATLLAQDLARPVATIAQGNGWNLPLTDQTIVGFLYNNGAEVGQAALNAKVDAYIGAGRLPSTARPLDAAGVPRDALICGLTPDANTREPLTAQRAFCEAAFVFRGDPSTNPTAHPSAPHDYTNPCTSRAYFCGTITRAWFATEICDAAYALDGGALTQATNPDTCLLGEYDSTLDYDVWHFVVGASPGPCRGLSEPGFLATATGAAQPYIAHDLDILAPPGSSLMTHPGDNVIAFADYYDEQVDRASGVHWHYQVSGFVTGATYNTHSARATITPDPADVPIGSPLVRKSTILEPNAPGDNSRTLSAPRAASDPCAPVVNAGLQRAASGPRVETQLDPWVNYIDHTIIRGVSHFEGSAGTGVQTETGTEYDLYANTNGNQDATSRPVNGAYWTTGNVGIFADVDDDFIRADAADLYEPVVEAFTPSPSHPADNRFAIDPFWISTMGAYPMYWEVYLNKNDIPVLPADGSEPHCRPPWANVDAGRHFLRDEMAAAGYDILRTGLLQAVYTKAPAVAALRTNYFGPGIQPPVVIAPPALIVWMSPNLHELRLFGSADQKAFVNGLVAEARTLAGAPATISTVFPRDSISMLTNPSDPAWGSGVMWRIAQNDFLNTCNSSSGFFENRWMLTHTCGGGAAAGVVCGGDRIVTGYTFRLNAPLGSDKIPAPPIALPVGVQTTWWDVDRFDNT